MINIDLANHVVSDHPDNEPVPKHTILPFKRINRYLDERKQLADAYLALEKENERLREALKAMLSENETTMCNSYTANEVSWQDEDPEMYALISQAREALTDKGDL